MNDNSVDAPTLARRKFRTGELVHLSFSVLRRNFLLLALAGVIPRIPLLIVDLGDIVPIIRESYDGLQTIGFSVLQGYVGLGYMTETLIAAVLGAIASATALYRAFQNMRGIRVHFRGALRVGLDRFLPLFALRVSLVIMLLAIFFSAMVPLQDDRLRQFLVAAMLLPILMLAMLGVLVRWFLFDPVCVIERLDIFRSLKRSGVLTKGDRLRILGIGGLIAAGPAAVQMAFHAAFGDGIGAVARFIADSFSGASLLALNVAYYDLRTSPVGASEA